MLEVQIYAIKLKRKSYVKKPENPTKVAIFEMKAEVVINIEACLREELGNKANGNE